MPPLHEEGGVQYASIACTHLNTALRFLLSGASSPAGDLSGLLESQPNLKEAAEVGHKWWVLPEDTDPQLLSDISNWRNQDQAENQVAHEMELLQMVATAATALASKSEFVSIRDLIAKASRTAHPKQVGALLETLCKFFVKCTEAGHPELINELIEYHSQQVNPNEVIVSGKLFENVVRHDV